LLLAFAIAFAGCVQAGTRAGDPDLPEGFGAVLPDAPLGGYIHMGLGGEPMSIAEGIVAPDGTLLPIEGDVESLSIWLGPFDVDGFSAIAARVRFPKQSGATIALNRLNRTETSSSLWTRQRGAVLDLVLGDGVSAVDIIIALTNDLYVNGDRSARAATNSLQSFPPQPSQQVLGAGWIQFTPRLMPVALRALAKQGWPDLQPVTGLLSQSGVKHVAFAVYGDSVPDVIRPSEVAGALAGQGTDALFVTDTTLAAPLLSLTFNVVAQRLGLTPVRLSSGRGFVYRAEGLSTVARTRGGTIFASLSTSEASAADLLGQVGS
jgi:hypothetical protein